MWSILRHYGIQACVQITIHSNRNAFTASTAPLSTWKQATTFSICAEEILPEVLELPHNTKVLSRMSY